MIELIVFLMQVLSAVIVVAGGVLAFSEVREHEGVMRLAPRR